MEETNQCQTQGTNPRFRPLVLGQSVLRLHSIDDGVAVVHLLKLANELLDVEQSSPDGGIGDDVDCSGGPFGGFGRHLEDILQRKTGFNKR